MAAVGDSSRRKSPRAPGMALDEALDRVLKIYDKDRIHSIPTDIAARHMGYSGANNGAALTTLASLGYFGLIERPKDGMISVSRDVESYKFAPNEDMRKAFLRRFLATPPLFAELLDRAQGGMPSDESLKYELIQRGFLPSTAASLVGIFKRSVDFADALSDTRKEPEVEQPSEVGVEVREESSPSNFPKVHMTGLGTEQSQRPNIGEVGEHDHIPVRLAGSRRAWLVIPAVFYQADKDRLKAQIDLLLTQDDEELL